MFLFYALFAPISINKLVVAILVLGINSSCSAIEVQDHGLWFEKWLCDTFFDGYRAPSYTQKWDIPASANPHYGHLPVNPKATKLGSPLGLGDALRQFDVAYGTESFILIVGFWKQATPTEKTWVNTQAVTISPEQWQKLWNPITRTHLEKLNAIIKDTSRTLDETRRLAHSIKSQPPFTESIIQVNPKIDRSQRRLQCSLGFNAFFDSLLPGSSRDSQEDPKIWGLSVPKVINNAARRIEK